MSRASEPSSRVAEILQVPPTLATGRYRVSRQAAVGVALVVALAVAVLLGRYLLARQEAAPQPVAVSEPTQPTQPTQPTPPAEPTEPTGTPTEGAAAASPASPAEVTVHVVGEVADPGVVTLPGGSRVGAALEEAGGTTSRADLTAVNLARPLADGEQIVVPAPGDPAPTPGASGTAGSEGAAAPAGGPVNLNTADAATLETLPGVGPVLAQRIIDWRTEHGGFTAVEELGEVSGIGEKIYAQLAPEVVV